MPDIKRELGRLVLARGAPASMMYLEEADKICIIAPQGGEFDLIEYFQWALKELKDRKAKYDW